MSKLLSVKDALSQILDGVETVGSEDVALHECGGRFLAQDVAAKRTQPPFSASAMDGYAVNADDIQSIPCTLQLIGQSAAGHGYPGSVGRGECVRIFTGAPVPGGADTIIIQENTRKEGSSITIIAGENSGRYVRRAGMDFTEDDHLLASGTKLNASTISLAAAMNHPTLPVYRKPVVAIIATGDELRMPGDQPGPDQIIASNSFGVAEIVRNAGGEPLDLGIAVDTMASLEDKFSRSATADIVVTLGGASVGDHDLVSAALQNNGVSLNFWKLAMRPGKPVMFGKSVTADKSTRFIGLPGNPVSSLVCALIFVVPLIQKLIGQNPVLPRVSAILGSELTANDEREEYLRATLKKPDGQYLATPFPVQDSSVLSLMAKADCLVVRPANAPRMLAGEPCEIILL